MRQRLADAKREREKAEEDRKAAPPPDDTPALAEARRWMLDAHAAALSAEVRMLEEELLTQPARLDLMRAQADQAARRLEAAKSAYVAFEEQVNDRRRTEADRAREQAKAVERDTAGKHPLLKHLAEQNAALGEALGAMAASLDGIAAEQQDEMAVMALGMSEPTPPGGITAEVVAVDSFDALEALPDDAVRGKIVLGME